MSKTKTKKPNCYECIHRGDVPGDAHSCCRHPANKPLLDDPMFQIMSMFASVGRVDPKPASGVGIKVVGNSYGIKKGWFNYPVNFDPTWLEECNGFEKKAVPSDLVQGIADTAAGRVSKVDPNDL